MLKEAGEEAVAGLIQMSSIMAWAVRRKERNKPRRRGGGGIGWSGGGALLGPGVRC